MTAHRIFPPIVAHSNRTRPALVSAPRSETVSEQEFRVLVINGSTEMAKEISLQLTLSIPGCAIMYAPSIELARLILLRRDVDLIVSSTLLPDGGTSRLQALLQKYAQRSPQRKPPTLVLVGEAPAGLLKDLSRDGYDVSHVRRVSSVGQLPENAFHSLSGTVLSRTEQLRRPRIEHRAIRSLGADLRNDLNNPLQEIVAMVFVARSSADNESGVTSKALDAIDRAAKNMAAVVKSLEDKISSAVAS